VALIIRRARMEGFIILDYFNRFPEAQAEMAGWLDSGQLKARQHIAEGLEHAPEALSMLFTGANTGKVIVRV
jgi:NADPH-dependent curcumin reductase CurA